MLGHSVGFVPLVALWLYLPGAMQKEQISETGIWQTSQRVNSIPMAANQEERTGRTEKRVLLSFQTLLGNSSLTALPNVL